MIADIEDEAAAAKAHGYFSPTVDHCNLSAGDIILCVSGCGASPALSVLVANVSGTTAATAPLTEILQRLPCPLLATCGHMDEKRGRRPGTEDEEK
ncbi:MAG: hypothetical protein AB7E32_04385 [Desulfovibrio sp.]